MPDASVATSAEVEVYASWALIMVRMIQGSVGADPWTVVQNKLHPAVAEFTPLNLSYMTENRMKIGTPSRSGGHVYPETQFPV
jgi:hypothetical protein